MALAPVSFSDPKCYQSELSFIALKIKFTSEFSHNHIDTDQKNPSSNHHVLHFFTNISESEILSTELTDSHKKITIPT